MELTNILGFVFVILAVGLIVILTVAGRTRTGRAFREIRAFTLLRRAVGRAVESGTRMHISLGRGDIIGTESASAFVGLAMQERVARAASISDRPPIATAGSGSIGILARDTFSGAYRSMGVEDQFDPYTGRVVGLTPFSYAAGVLPVIHDEHVAANLLAGHFGSEVALINEAAERSGSLTVAGTDDITGQAILYGSAQEPLIGEELFAGGAYLGAGAAHEASLRAQDLLRIFVIVLIILAAVIYFFGFDQLIADFVQGFLS